MGEAAAMRHGDERLQEVLAAALTSVLGRMPTDIHTLIQ